MSEIIQTTGSTEDNIILFEMNSQGTLRSMNNPAELAAKSVQALTQAMGTIQAMANQMHQVVSKLPSQPAEVELEFGIKVDADTGVMIAKDSSGSNLRIKMVWQQQD